MASIPPSAFSTGRIRETQRDMKVSKPNKGGESRSYFNTNGKLFAAVFPAVCFKLNILCY